MKKRMLILGALLCVVLTAGGCGGGDEAGADVGAMMEGAAAGSSERRELPAVLRLGEPRFGDLDMMIEHKVIRVVTTYSRTNYFVVGGEPKGATYEGLMQFEKFLNERLGTARLKVHVFIVPVRRDELLRAVVDGRADLAAASITVTPERLEQVDFSDAAVGGISEVLVTGPESPELASLDDLSGKTVAVRKSSSYYQSLRALSDDFHSRGLSPIRIREVDERLETEDIMEMVGAGTYPLTVADSHIAEFWSDILAGVEVREDIAVGTGRSIAWAFRKDSPKLAAEVNAFVKGHKKGTLFGNILMKRYFEDNKAVRNPLSGSELEKLQRYRAHFEKYAAQYGMDWLLVAAQGYQESGLEQSLKSSHGAVGVMQIKPTTAADKNVGIPDVSTAENNIHAGIKYMRFIRDRYFDDDEMDSFNKGFFTLAAYNAGPARIQQVREQARAKGLDPNVWFRQVEQVAPRQTVDYVANIFKYWVTYREFIETRDAVDRIKGE